MKIQQKRKEIQSFKKNPQKTKKPNTCLQSGRQLGHGWEELLCHSLNSAASERPHSPVLRLQRSPATWRACRSAGCWAPFPVRSELAAQTLHLYEAPRRSCCCHTSRTTGRTSVPSHSPSTFPLSYTPCWPYCMAGTVLSTLSKLTHFISQPYGILVATPFSTWRKKQEKWNMLGKH